MKHPIFVFVCLSLLCVPVVATAEATNLVLQYEQLYLRDDPAYQLLWAENEKIMVDLRSRQAAWLPDFGLTPSYTYEQAPLPGNDSIRHELGARLDIAQQLPWGGTLSLDASPTLSLNTSPEDASSVSGAASVRLSLPVLGYRVFSQSIPGSSLLYGLELQHETLAAAWKVTRFEALLQRLEQHFRFLLLSERVDWYQQRIEVAVERYAVIQQRYEAGDASLIEVRDFERQLHDQQQEQRERERQLATLRSSIPGELLSPASSRNRLSIEDWLEQVEQGLSRILDGPLSLYRLQAQNARTTEQLFSRMQDEIAQSPTIDLSANWNPPAASVDSLHVEEVLHSWWDDSLDSGSYSVSFSVRIPLAPYNRIYHSGARIRLEERIAELNRRIAAQQQGRQYALSGILAQIESQALQQAERTVRLEQDRLELFTIRRTQGDIDELELTDQVIQVELARLHMLQVRGEGLFRTYQGAER